MGWASSAVTLGTICVGLAAMARYKHERAAVAHAAEFIRFKAYGDETKPPVVIVPGLDGVPAFFSDVIPELTPNFYVVLFNLPLVPPPLSQAASEAEPYTMSFIARKLAAVMDEAGIKERAGIVGESFGGMVAQRLTLDFPEKVDRLVVLSSLAKTELTATVKLKAQILLPIVESIGYLFPFVAQNLFALAHVSDVVESHEPHWAKQLFLKEASWADHWSVMARCKVAISFDSSSELGQIKTGALVMYGEDDTFTAVGTRQLLGGIAGSRSKGLPGGHLCHITNPKAFSAAVTEYILSAA